MRKSKSILIIDDDPDMRVYLRKLLEGMGHEVHEAEDSLSAEKKLTAIYPHLILLDINLENENGFNFISQVRKIDPHRRIKVIMISSLSSKKAIELSQRIGTNGYLIKPINNNILMTTMKKIMPDLDLLEATIVDQNTSRLTAKCMGQVTKISEVELVLRSKIKFSEKMKLNISSKFLKKIEIDRAQFVIHRPSRDVQPGIYDTDVSIVGLKEKDLKGIRSLKTKKA
ncbi:response regulator [Bacteriovorax sp. Seq25_V]|uniref:response regulator n=1 Tax=Bacteriovorax sp. Seq25_V TaxID=1201288 RepID=UPI000389FECD|nr:response regulator [Bacteriovorax sp. Seq25_V]EQC43997.1 response regulator receiver domain protein [Bacteriovorax sp. Seq25_V]